MGLGFVWALLLVQTAYQLDDSPVLPSNAFVSSAQSQLTLSRSLWGATNSLKSPQNPATFSLSDPANNAESVYPHVSIDPYPQTVRVTRYESKWQEREQTNPRLSLVPEEDSNWTLFVISALALVFGFSIGARNVRNPGETKTPMKEKPVQGKIKDEVQVSFPCFETGRFLSTFTNIRLQHKSGAIAVYSASHALDENSYIIHEQAMWVSSAADIYQHPWFQHIESWSQGQDSKDVLRYITCWIEQGDFAQQSKDAKWSVRLLTQLECLDNKSVAGREIRVIDY